MTTLYNCHHSGDQYRITKFVDGSPEASYLCTHSECQCPAGIRETCRHRQMLPHFLNHNLVDSALFLNWDRGRTICDINGLPTTFAEPKVADEYLEGITNRRPHSTAVCAPDLDSVDGGSNPPVAAKPAWRRI